MIINSVAPVPGGGHRERSGLGDQEIMAERESENNWNIFNSNKNFKNYLISYIFFTMLI